MRLQTITNHEADGLRRKRQSGMTLVEVYITLTLGCLMLFGLITTMIFIMRQDQLVESKLGAGDQSRKAFDKMSLEIRKAKVFRVGNGTETTFASIPNGTAQSGTAIQLSFTTDTNSYVRYYFETNNYRLCRKESGVSGYSVIASDLTNNMSFRAENHLGNIVTDITYKYVIKTALHFRQFQYPLTQVGPGYLYDYYKIEFKVCPHNPDGA